MSNTNTKIPNMLGEVRYSNLHPIDRTIMDSLSPEELKAYISLMGPDMDDCRAIIKGTDEFIKCPYYDSSREKCLYEETDNYDKSDSCTEIIGNYLNLTEEDADTLNQCIEELKSHKKIGKKRFHGLFR